MQVLGVDFTSRPTRAKPITWARCHLAGDVLRFDGLDRFADFAGFEAALRRPGPWVAGFDFPFGHARRFVEAVGWPAAWPAYADHLGGLTRDGYRAILESYKAGRAYGDREHPRGFEAGTGAASPQKLYGVPVGLMLFEGVPRLRRAGVDVPGLCAGDAARVAVEAYPGMLARRLIGRRSYKSDDRRKATADLAAARRDILDLVRGGALTVGYGLTVVAPDWLANESDGDSLDALLCAVQAAWAWRRVLPDIGALAGFDPLEGWIADPSSFRGSTA